MKARLPSLSIPKKHSKSHWKQGEPVWTVSLALKELKRQGNPKNAEGLVYFGIRARKTLGVSAPRLQRIARRIGKNHALGLELWRTGIHDARHLAVMVSEPERVTAAQMERWVRDFNSWDICDGTCCHLFVDTRSAWNKARAWTRRKQEFQKRAGFALAAYLAVHDRKAPDSGFEPFLKAIEREAGDERNFVKKAVNWALRQIGKRNRRLNRLAIATAETIRHEGTKSGRWIAADALRELHSAAVEKRLLRKAR